MDDNRREELRARLGQETNDPESQEWREDLTPEELEYVNHVNQLDSQHITAGVITCTDLLLFWIRERFRQEEIAELETIRGHCRLRLRDGRMYIARLGRDNRLKLDEIDGVC